MRKILIAVAIVLLVGSTLAALFLRGGASAPTAATTPTPPTTQSAKQTAPGLLASEGRVVPIHSAALSLPIGGIIADIAVAEGDQVQAGQVLVRLNQSRSTAAIAQAEADLAQAQAAAEKVRAGPTPAEIRIAEAQLRTAQAQLRQATGNVTTADQAALTAQLAQAQAHLNALRAGPTKSERDTATAQLALAQANLVTQRDQLSAAKTTAKLQVERSTSELTKAQSNDSTALQNWQYVQDTNRDPITPWLGIDPTTGEKIPNKLGDAQRQQYYAAYIQAEATLRNAEIAVQQARIANDAARLAEVSGIQAAEQQVAISQANLEQLRAGATNDELAAARALVASSQANLEKLSGEQRDGVLDAAKASVDQAQANLEKLRAGASQSDIAAADAVVQRAQAALTLAQINQSDGELRAPFAGTIAAINSRIGEYSVMGTPMIQLADLSTWQIETTDLTERNVIRVREGSPATITFDSISGLELPGTVSRIRALGEAKQGDITYVITIKLNQQDPRLRWNMTASVTIEQ
jgi:HlyD family secretion protein